MYNKTKCIDTIPEGYFLIDANNKIIDKCNIKCKTCNKESNINNLCLSCNIENKYYPIINNFTKNNSFINCSNYIPSGFVFDNFTYKACYSTCKECLKVGDNYNHQCLSCIDNHYLNNTNCISNCSYYYYFDDSHVGHCTEERKCPENKTKLIKEKRECIENCSNDNIYKFEYNNECYNYFIFPENTTLIANNDTQENIGKQSENIIFNINSETQEIFEKSLESTTFIINNYTQENFEKIPESTILNINTISQENIKNSQENAINYLDENIILDEDNDKNINYLINNLNNSYIKVEHLEGIKNGYDLILIENNELKISLITSDIKKIKIQINL